MRNKTSFPFFAACFLGLLLCMNLGARAQKEQQPSAATAAPPFPIVPLLVEYEYAPVFFSQWELDDPHYSSITAIIGKGNPPVYKIVLEEKRSEKGPARKVYYSNSEATVISLKREGRDAHLAAIDYKVVESVGQQPSHGFGFRDVHGRAILWRFVPASRPSELGAGLTPMPGAPGLRLEYRDIGTLAGAGTAVQIGDRVSEAPAWPQVSSPPYFIAHRGSFTEGRHIGLVLAGSESWRVVAQPKELREGAEWNLLNERGVERTLRVRSRRGDELTIGEVRAEDSNAGAITLNVRVAEKSFALRSLLLTSGSQAMRVSFDPELNLGAGGPAQNASEVGFQIDQGEHKRVAQGVVLVERQGNVIRLRWKHKSPDWAKSRTLDTSIKVEPAGYSIESHSR